MKSFFYPFFVVRNGAVQYGLNVKWCPLIKLGHSIPRWFLSFCLLVARCEVMFVITANKKNHVGPYFNDIWSVIFQSCDVICGIPFPAFTIALLLHAC